MKRNMELVRKILFSLEDRASTVAETLDVEEYPMEKLLIIVIFYMTLGWFVHIKDITKATG